MRLLILLLATGLSSTLSDLDVDIPVHPPFDDFRMPTETLMAANRRMGVATPSKSQKRGPGQTVTAPTRKPLHRDFRRNWREYWCLPPTILTTTSPGSRRPI